MPDPRPRVYFLDIDGVLVEYSEPVYTGRAPMVPLPGVIEKLHEWKANGHTIILTTGRPATPEETMLQLDEAGLVYDHLISGLGGGVRVLINDRKPDGEVTAVAYSPARNLGIAHIQE